MTIPKSRIEREKHVVTLMVRIYCRKKEGNKELCDICRSLLTYAHKQLEYCKFGETKTTCQDCPIHCYQPEMRRQIRQIMRFSGPRMLLYHPIIALRHLMGK